MKPHAIECEVRQRSEALVTFRHAERPNARYASPVTRYYQLEPEVPGGLGPQVLMELRPDAYPLVQRPDLEFSYGYLGDDLLTTHPVYFVTTALAETLSASALTGFALSTDLEVSVDPQLLELDPDWVPPSIEWLRVHGAPERDDFGLTTDASLIVSARALDVLRSHRIRHCDIKPSGDIAAR